MVKRVGRGEEREGGKEREGEKREETESEGEKKIVSNHPTPSNGGPIYRFLASHPCRTAGWLALLLIKAGDVETNPGPTTLNKRVWICDICYKQIHVRKQISIRCNMIEHWVHLRCAGTRQTQYICTQIPGPAIYTDNLDSQLTQT